MTSLADTAPACRFMKSCTESSVDAARPLGSDSFGGGPQARESLVHVALRGAGTGRPAAGEASCSRKSR